MVKTLEDLSEEESLEDKYSINNPHLEYVAKSIKDPKRKEEFQREINRVFSKYMTDLRRYNPNTRRATILEQAYNSVPEDEENSDSKQVLQQRLYSNPGRQYTYINNITGTKKKSSQIKAELSRAAKYTIKDGWPVLGAGTAWWLTNKAYKAQIAKGLTGRLATAFEHKWYEYLVPGLGQTKAAIDTAEFAGKEGLLKAWGVASTPLLYAMGAYAVYKTINYFLKRKKEKRLEQEEIRRLESSRNRLRLQRQNFQPEQIEEAA